MLDQQPVPMETPIQPTKNLDAYKALLEVDAHERNFKKRSGYTGAYVASVLIPPIGIYYFVKYLFFSDGTNEDIKAGVISLALTLVSLILTIWLSASMFKQLLPGDSSRGMDSLKNLTSPDSRKEIMKLYQ